MIVRLARMAAVAAVVSTVAVGASPPPAQATNVVKPICTLAGLISGIAGRVCSAASHAGQALKAGKKLLGGHLGGALESLAGSSTAVKALTAGAVLAALVAWVSGGAKAVLRDTATVISTTTRPQLQSTWFSSTYWRMAAISALLTLPFLFAAAIQALMRSDMAMLLRSTLGYLPLGLLAVAIAAPLTTLLLAGSDELSAIVSGASGGAGAAFLTRVGFASGALSQLSGSTFVLLFAGLLTVAATITLWIELLIRSAAVYVVVLMLPLFFAALVWPARRIWAVRAVELLVALILSKFAIVAVLSLGAAALGHTTIPSATQMLEGATLVMLAAFSPWALLRLLPLHELTSGLDGLRSRPQQLAPAEARAQQAAEVADGLIRQLPAGEPPPPRTAPDEVGAARGAVRGLDGDAHAAAENGDRATSSSGPPERSGDRASSPMTSPEPVGDRGSSSSNSPEPAAGQPIERDAPTPSASTPSYGGPTRAEALAGAEHFWHADDFGWSELRPDRDTRPPEAPEPADSGQLQPTDDDPRPTPPEPSDGYL